MPKRSSKATTPTTKKHPSDINLLAAQIVEATSGQAEEPTTEAQPERNPAAVVLGRLGGLKDGKAMAD